MRLCVNVFFLFFRRLFCVYLRKPLLSAREREAEGFLGIEMAVLGLLCGCAVAGGAGRLCATLMLCVTAPRVRGRGSACRRTYGYWTLLGGGFLNSIGYCRSFTFIPLKILFKNIFLFFSLGRFSAFIYVNYRFNILFIIMFIIGVGFRLLRGRISAVSRSFFGCGWVEIRLFEFNFSKFTEYSFVRGF